MNFYEKISSDDYNVTELSDISFSVDLDAKCQPPLHHIAHFLHTFRPFMITCAVEYNMICAATIFVLWLNIGYSSSKWNPLELRRARKRQLRVDCSASTQGVFLGLEIFENNLQFFQKFTCNHFRLISVYSNFETLKSTNLFRDPP